MDAATSVFSAHSATEPREVTQLTSGELTLKAAWPARGRYAPGYEKAAACFADHIRSGEEVGAGFTVYAHGKCVVDLYGGYADIESKKPWQADTRLVVFSVTKGFAAMALSMLAESGAFSWDDPVANVWPGFARNGKGYISFKTLFQHQGGLAYLTQPLTMDDCVNHWDRVVAAMEDQKPAWTPGQGQGYHAITYGMYALEVWRRLSPHESMGAFLQRTLFDPLGSDVRLGAGPELDGLVANLYPPSTPTRVGKMLMAGLFDSDSTEGRVARASLRPESIGRRAFLNPALGPRGVLVYNDEKIRRAELPWGSATASAHGVARAYLPFALEGSYLGKEYLKPESLLPIYERGGWSLRDSVLQKPLGWSRGFLKEETHLFSPNPESFGHAGMGGALGYCDPVAKLSWGYVMNRMDYRVRSPRAVALCRALYACDAVKNR